MSERIAEVLVVVAGVMAVAALVAWMDERWHGEREAEWRRELEEKYRRPGPRGGEDE